MVRFVFILLLGLSLSSPAFAMESLKSHALLSDDVIRLGDLFTGLKSNEDRVLGRGPKPGHHMTLNARTLLRVSKAMDLDWRPISEADRITVTRAATVIDTNAIDQIVTAALEKVGVEGDIRLKYNQPSPELILPPTMGPSAEITLRDYDPDTGWFQADLSAPSRNNPVAQIQLSGKIEYLTAIPVLKAPLRLGSTIGENDVTTLSVPSKSLNHDVFLHAEDLVGLTPRRMIAAGKPVKANDVQAPRIVARGEAVTLIYKAGALNLTARGKALEFGAKGDVIRVVNTQSNRSIDAIVTGDQEVTAF